MTNRRPLASVLAAVAATLSLACSPANVGGVDAGPSAEQACGDSAYARCSRLQTCSSTLLQLRYGDVGTCEALTKSSCVATLAAPSTGSSATSVEACVQAMPGWSCDDYIVNVNPPPECQPSTGALAAGAACAFAAQCQSGFCAVVPGAACGTCAPVPQAGDSCAQLTTCGMGMSCLTATSTCEPPAQPMAACLPSQTCAVGYECIGSSVMTGASGTCQHAGEAVGVSCSSSTNQCDFYAGFTCNEQSKQCVAVQFVGSGQACNYIASASESMYCGGGGKCLSASPGMQGTCAGASSVGGPCDLAAGPECIAPSHCLVSAGGGTSGSCAIQDGTACH